MSMTSTIRTESAPAIAVVNEGESLPVAAVASRFNKVTIIDERNASVVDRRGRTIKVRRLSALDRLRLFKLVGSVHSENRIVSTYYINSYAVTEIDGVPVAQAQSDIALDAIVGRLDEDGLEAVFLALMRLSRRPKT
jgi:hypothetical protein